VSPDVDMPTLDRWPFPQDPIPRSWAAASKVTVAAVGIFSKLWAGMCLCLDDVLGLDSSLLAHCGRNAAVVNGVTFCDFSLAFRFWQLMHFTA